MGYIYLAIAITGELIGTTCLKFSDGFTKLAPSALTVVSYVICFYSFSKCLLTINLSFAYAVWSGLGIAAATLLSIFLFKEGTNLASIIGIALILIGVIILNVFGVSQN